MKVQLPGGMKTPTIPVSANMIGGLGFAIAILGPFLLTEVQTRTATMLVFAIAIASAYNIIGGITGYPSFGHVVFLGVGAYSSAILYSEFGVEWWMTVPLGGVAALLLSVPLGPILLRLKGHYFAIATLALHLAVQQYIGAFPFLGGGRGWFVPTQLSFDVYYWVFLTLAALIVGINLLLSRSQVGTALRGIGKNEPRAKTLAIPTSWYKNISWNMSTFLLGVVGVFYGNLLGFIDQASVLSLTITLDMIMYGIVGGMGTVWGPVLGAVILMPMEEFVWANYIDFHLLLKGFLIIAFVLYFPKGLIYYVRLAVGRFQQDEPSEKTASLGED
jgi:branched-chain amino acid transport system permease protein